MNLLDENVREDQRTLLRQWRIPFSQVGREISRKGILDENLLPLLHKLKRPTFLTQDQDFVERRHCHRAYCLVWLDVINIEVAAYVRRVLRHPAFRAQKQRMGRVLHVHPASVEYWQVGKASRTSLGWPQS